VLAAFLWRDSGSAPVISIDEQVKGSLVYIAVDFTGYVHIPANLPNLSSSGQAAWSDQVKAEFTCSGFAVDPSGFIATAGNCVDPGGRDVKEAIRRRFVQDAVNSGKLDSSEADQTVATANAQEWPVEGKDSGSPVDRQVQVIQPDNPSRVIDRWTTAQVVDFQKFDDGNNALLKVSGMRPLTPLVVSDKPPVTGQALIAVGFPGAVGDVTDQSRVQQPSFNPGTVSSQQVGPNGTSGTAMTADIFPGMSGGPTVDNTNGEVLGINSYAVTLRGENQGFFITDAQTLRTFLLKNGVHLAEPAPAKKPFPLVWIIVGVVAAVVVVAMIVLLELSGTKKRRQQAPEDGPQQP
jgi:hypothetical protein